MWWLFWLNDPIWHRYVTFEPFKDPFKDHIKELVKDPIKVLVKAPVKVHLTIAQIFDAVLCPQNSPQNKNSLPDNDLSISHWHLPDINEDINI